VGGFDYLSVMVSIVVGVGLTQLFAGIGNVVQVRRRIERYWLHTLWVLLLVFIHVQVWWSFWALRAVRDWTFLEFGYVLVGPGLLVIASHIVLPELVDDEIDVRAHYYDTSPLFFGLLAGVALWAICLEPMMGLAPLLAPLRGVQALGATTLVVCAGSRSERLHALGLALIVALMFGSIAITRFRLAPAAS
jgi:hypothetical protein